jgi:hypothetical protein
MGVIWQMGMMWQMIDAAAVLPLRSGFGQDPDADPTSEQIRTKNGFGSWFYDIQEGE